MKKNSCMFGVLCLAKTSPEMLAICHHFFQAEILMLILIINPLRVLSNPVRIHCTNTYLQFWLGFLMIWEKPTDHSFGFKHILKSFTYLLDWLIRLYTCTHIILFFFTFVGSYNDLFSSFKTRLLKYFF